MLFKMSENMQTIIDNYNNSLETSIHIKEHLPNLYLYATQCQVIVHLGLFSLDGIWSFIYGLVHSPLGNKCLHCVSVNHLPRYDDIIKIGKNENININIIKGSSLNNDLPIRDMTFIDTWHVYGQLKRELEIHAPKTRKFIIMHDTTIDGEQSESIRCKWDIEQQSIHTGYTIEEITMGIWPAIELFLKDSKEWKLKCKYTNNNGLTILERKSSKVWLV